MIGTAILALVLAACGSSATQAVEDETSTVPPTATQTVIPIQDTPTVTPLLGSVRIWLSWKPDAVNSLKLLTEAFSSLHPNVGFSITYFPLGEIIPTLLASTEAGSLPTVFFAPSHHGPQLLSGGVIRDLRMSLPTDLPDQLYPLAWSQVRYGETVLGVPLRMDGNVLYRNRTLVPIPAAKLSDLLESAHELRSVGLTGAFFDFATGFSAPFAVACDSDLAPVDGGSGFLAAGGLCWLELLRVMSAAGPVTIGGDEDILLFESAIVGWYLGSTEETLRLNQSLGERVVSIDPWPLYTTTGRRLSGFVWTENAYVHAGIEEADLAANIEFLLFLISPEAQLTLAGNHGGRFNSVRPSVIPADPQLQQIKAALELGVPLPIWAGTNPYHEALERAVRAVAIQGTDSGTAHERALLEIESDSNSSQGDGGE